MQLTNLTDPVELTRQMIDIPSVSGDEGPLADAVEAALCGAGFGLFQSPNNSLIISSAPPGRSGGASGMLATARLVGQTTGAALVALLFHLFADNGATVCLTIAGSVAATGAVVSSIRISQPLPEALSRKGSGA